MVMLVSIVEIANNSVIFVEDIEDRLKKMKVNKILNEDKEVLKKLSDN